jgi:uncharacterized membrane protein
MEGLVGSRIACFEWEWEWEWEWEQQQPQQHRLPRRAWPRSIHKEGIATLCSPTCAERAVSSPLRRVDGGRARPAQCTLVAVAVLVDVGGGPGECCIGINTATEAEAAGREMPFGTCRRGGRWAGICHAIPPGDWLFE